MAYYYFLASTDRKIAITADPRGANLPPLKSGRWQFVKKIPLLDVIQGAAPADITLAIERDGFWTGVN
jgi:hypothetical protein